MKTLFLFSLFISIPLFSQCIGTGCPGNSSGGAVSSVFTRTGAVTAVSGDYTQAQVTATTAQPAIYYCATSAYSDPTYTCSTGLSISTPPPTGTLFLINFQQVCLDTVANQITIDSLASKSMIFGDGQNMPPAVCNTIGSQAILRVNNLGAGAFSLTVISNSNSPVCFSVAGGIYYNNTGAAGCNSKLAVVNNDLRVNHVTGITNTTSTIVGGTGAGTSPGTINITGTGDDMSGIVNITTGTAPATSAIIATITFGASWSLAQPTCIIYPHNLNTALLTGTSMVYVTGTTANWVINSNTVGLSSATAYSWNYVCIQ